MQGTNCAALAPVPMTATRRPASSTESSQAAEWKDGPAKRSRPSMAGKDGRLSWPTAQTTPSNSSVALGAVAGAHGQATSAAWSSSKRASVTSLRKRMHSPSSSSLAVACR